MKITPGAIQDPDLAALAESARSFTRKHVGIQGNIDSVLIIVDSNGDNEGMKELMKAETLMPIECRLNVNSN